ncbi:MAG: chorismate synthase [Chloroflexi bacterium HGW-Chloroflexi-3]|nr:MAG: chorismate synthase [Chloroflexi bacterium HGW-Chloroflexi-3]
MTLRFLTAGESHGLQMTAIVDGLPAGIPVDVEQINVDLARRQKSLGAGGRMRIENDQVVISSGVMAGKTIGAPVTLVVENRDHTRWTGKEIKSFTTPRPGHADLSGLIKYGMQDIRPVLERASARETVSRVAVGALCRQFLAQFGIQIGGYVSAIGTIQADLSELSFEERIRIARNTTSGCPHPDADAAMQAAIESIMHQGDTLGGVIEVIALGVPPGLGSYVQYDRRLDARLASAMLSVQAMKAVEIGDAFTNAALRGSQVHDPINLVGDQILRLSNRDGGLEGGVTTGQPLLLRVAMKPIATTLIPQRTVDLSSAQETETIYERSDFCPVPRAVVILEAMAAIVLADALIEKLGGDSIAEMEPRFQLLRQARLADLQLKQQTYTWWEV